MDAIDETHDADRSSWVDSANDPKTDFPIQNLPLGVGRNTAGEPTAVVAIGDAVLDLDRVAVAGLLHELDAERARGEDWLNRLLAQDPSQLTSLRRSLFHLLERGAEAEGAIRGSDDMLRPAPTVELLTPLSIGSFTDFMAGIYHARAASEAMRGAGKLGANYCWMPVAYQSRASTVRASERVIRRPSGQLPQMDADPVYAPSEMLDFELELGFFVSESTVAGQPVPIGDAHRHIAGFCLLNDWSARDIQRWEMPPLGPFLAKNFATTISPWMVTADALRPFRIPAMERPDTEPRPLPHLWDDSDQAKGGVDVELSVWLRTPAMREQGADREQILRSNARHLYWTPAQMLTHHTSSGCDLQIGDMLGSGTISGPSREQLASLLELTDDGRRPLSLSHGETRGYLQDGDELTITGRCRREGYVSIGFGECSGTICSGS